MTSGSHGTAVSSHAVASDFNVFIEAIAQGHLVTRMFQHRARQTERLSDGLGQRDLTLGRQRGNFVNDRHDGSPESIACNVRKLPYRINAKPHGLLRALSFNRQHPP